MCFNVDGHTVAITFECDRRALEGMRVSVVPMDLTGVDTPTVTHDMHGVVALLNYDGDPVAVLHEEPSLLRLWDVNDRQYIGRPVDLGGQAHSNSIEAAAIINGNPAVAVLWDDEAMLWDLITGRRIDQSIPVDFGRIRHHACEVVDGRFVVLSFTWKGIAFVWDLITGERIGQPFVDLLAEENLGVSGELSKATFAKSDDGILAVFHSNPEVLVWDVSSGHRLGGRLNHAGLETSALACTQLNGRAVAVTATYGDIQVWDLTTEELPGDVSAKRSPAIRGMAPARNESLSGVDRSNAQKALARYNVNPWRT